jgi:hypothetical protein
VADLLKVAGAERPKPTRSESKAADAVQVEQMPQKDDLPHLVVAMAMCQRDTLAVLGAGAAGRLAHWQEHARDIARLVRFIQDRIHGDAKQNGWHLEQAKKVSLERIVVDRFPHLFTPEDIQAANDNLGLPKG